MKKTIYTRPPVCITQAACEKIRTLKIENKYYQKLENSLDKIFSKKVFLDLDNQDKFLVDMGHFNFHGENILISDLKKLDKFKLIDPDTRWKILDPMFSMARYFYTYLHIYGNHFYKQNNCYL